MKRKREFICWYAYSGHETEGHVMLEEPKIFEAEDTAEAMWKYHEWLHKYRRGFDITKKYKDVDDFRRNDEWITGWGFWCRELKTE